MITFPCAKINLGLNIVSKRKDGYHNLETVFYPIPLTVTEMLREVTAENIAMQDKILHEIQLLSAIYELKYTTNQYENK